MTSKKLKEHQLVLTLVTSDNHLNIIKSIKDYISNMDLNSNLFKNFILYFISKEYG